MLEKDFECILPENLIKQESRERAGKLLVVVDNENG
jgi:hypothetical protein